MPGAGGPTEVRELASRFRDLTANLEQQVAGRTAALSAANDALRAQALELRRARDLADAANVAKSAFLANMSHEIRTPMHGVLGMLELILSEELPRQVRDWAQTASQSGTALMQILNDILDISKIEAGKVTVESAAVDVRSLCHSIAELFVHIAQALPESIPTDSKILRQIISNLVGNAVKFTERGEVVITAALVDAGGASPRLRVAVADTGIGIPADKQESIFDAFTQADNSHTRRFGGTGLGLTITKRLVQALNGTLWVTSEVGAGSRFEFEIPLAPRERDEVSFAA
jgi:signal transduction histidine kinase